MMSRVHQLTLVWTGKKKQQKGAHLAQCARSASAVQLFARVAVLETHTL